MPETEEYIVKGRYFYVSRSGIHLVNNGIIFATVQYNTIEKIAIKKGIEVDNWLVLLVTGLLISGFGIYLSWGVLRWVIQGEFAGSFRGLFMLMIPLVGLFFVYSALKHGPVMIISYGKRKSVKLPISDIIGRDEYPLMLRLLSKSIGEKLRVLVKFDSRSGEKEV